ncbi:tetratricopeptide repeat protein [Streptomyces lonegramiae]|uniref:Tetratricopeptide repeat protein n=1 Tax=Streptomyces lonegramiae TaxID=3075524 RepID=A0ABU2XTH2_9ACTN|nr:tetratricopeptide repeat protein [Streptomyces sp. DSM 41529]MDT0549211.1 tetratricopeptide repeat protein [Streptomyces sp. DSM 41529]
MRWRLRRRKPGPSASGPVPRQIITDTGTAHAHDGGAAVTGYRGPGLNTGGSPTGMATHISGTGDATTSGGAIANSGYLSIDKMNVALPTSRAPVAWPVRVGPLPALASAFQSRIDLRERIDQARSRHATVVLAQVLSGGGGVGKSQLTAAYASQALAEGIELVVWVNAAEIEQVTALYSQAAHRVQAPGAQGQAAEADAQAFLEWLATTPRSWLVVLDDITDPARMGPWWPPSPPTGGGRVLATTRRRDAVLSGGGRAVVDIGTYSPDEATAYLHDRLTSVGAAHLLDAQAGALTEELGRLPLALSHAAAYMINEDVTCARYLQLFTDRRSRLEQLLPLEADTEGYGRQVAAALLLTLDAAQACEPVGLAIPAIRLAAVLDPAGHPQDLWASAFVTDYLGATAPGEVGPEQARAVLRLLHRYGLITDDVQAGPRAVRLHALTARAARESTPAPEVPTAVRAAADALRDLWPAADHADPDLSAVLRTNTDTLATHAGDLLWSLGCHPVLYRAGDALNDTGLFTAAIAHWRRLAADAERLLGAEHPQTRAAHSSLARSYQHAGRIHDAIAIDERVAAECERLLGPAHPGTLSARANLAASYWYAGRTQDAITIEEQVVADRERVLGPQHLHTLGARANLAISYRGVGRIQDAITIEEQVAAESARLLGPQHPNTLRTRMNLASAYGQAGRTQDAINLLEQVVADHERLLGPEHPSTLTACVNLSAAYNQAGRIHDAIKLLEQVAPKSARLLGPQHPNTLSARTNLASAYGQAGRTQDAITIQEQVASESERLLGPEHPSTLGARTNLAASYQRAGRIKDAITV